MSSSGDVTLVVAIAATVIGVGVAFAMWRRQVRLERVSRRTHPSMQPPLLLTVVATGDDWTGDDAIGDDATATRRWAVTVRPDAPAISIDIVTFRASGSRQPWSSEPIIEPIRIEPGGSAALPSTFAAAPAYDAVVGWTEHRDDGDVERSRTFHCLDVGAGTVARGRLQPGRGRPRLDLIVSGLLIAALVIAVWGLITTDDSGTANEPDTTVRPSAPATSPPTTTPPATTVPATTPVVTTTPAGTNETTTAPTTTAPTSAVPTSTAAPTTAPGGPRVEIRGTIGECRFGSACLIAGFQLIGFDTAPNQYVCEFADGSRVTFGFGGDGVTEACATGSADAEITVEVAGVRSATITRETIADN